MVTLSEFTAMAKGHSFLWRKPGRPDEERKRFAALMRKVEAIRVRYGLKESALAGELETTADALRNWMSGRAIGGKETVARPRGVYSASDSAI